MDVNQDLKSGLIACFEAGIKPNQWIGAEFEHFVVDRTSLRTYDYYEPNGIRSILLELKNHGWQTHQSDDKLMFLQIENATITLEPGGQVELSIMPFEKIDDLLAIYKRFINDIHACLLPEQALMSCGFHPRSTISSIPFIPKGRYAAMSEHFKRTGRYGHHMMKGTASTQVGIDFSSEEDCAKKYRLFSALSPFIAAYFDSAAYFEGAPTVGHTVRTQIWRETDPARSGVPEMAFDPNFNFAMYADYIRSVPPILMQVGDDVIETGLLLIDDLYQEKPFDKKQFEHVLTMVFPDIRLKNFLEIRMADALPYPYNFAFIEMMHAIAYRAAIFEPLLKWSQEVTYQLYCDQRDLVTELGVLAPVLVPGADGPLVRDFMARLVDKILDTKESLPHLRAYAQKIDHCPDGYARYLLTLSEADYLKELEV